MPGASRAGPKPETVATCGRGGGVGHWMAAKPTTEKPSPAGITSSRASISCSYTDGTQPAPTAIFDNLELRTSEIPPVGIERAVRLSWPASATINYAVEGVITVTATGTSWPSSTVARRPLMLRCRSCTSRSSCEAPSRVVRPDWTGLAPITKVVEETR